MKSCAVFSIATLGSSLTRKKFVAGIPLECHYAELVDHYLLCATETTRKADMDALVKEVT